MNRLKLDFSLETAEERNNFLQTYLVQFPDLTHSEAETIADYLLWGKNDKGVPIGADTELKTKWTKTDEIDSLESIMENPAYSNVQLQSLTEATPLRKTREVFSRSEVEANAPAYILETFHNLWRQIDEDDLLINFYELGIGKREKPPRKELLDRFTPEEQAELSRRAAELSQYQYLKLRHELVEFGALIFNPNFDPAALNEEQLQLISKLIWEKKDVEPTSMTIDFRNLETLYQLYLMREDCNDQIEQEKEINFVEGNLEDIYRTLDFYESIADLTEVQRRLLRLKETHIHNTDIAGIINKEFGKNYTTNYISTIFRQKILTKIVDAVELHLLSIENCFFPENFKKCTECGRILLLDERNWVKKTRSKDGFQNRCKRCDREKRKKKKED